MRDAPTPESDSLLGALRTFYGYGSFRPQQRETIEHVLAGGDALVLMPTGGGKSLCYQLPAMLSDGLTVVVSPLIALMHDQVQALQRAGASAQYLNSTLSPMETAQTERLVADGSVRLLYVAPERLNTDRFRDLLERRQPSLIAIDEAHCISEWGHEFRTDYRKLRQLTERFVDVPTVACTATATPQVQRDIIDQLDRPRMRTFLTSFMRDNLTLRIVRKQKAMDRLIARLRRMPGKAAIVYSHSRKSTEQTAARLRENGIRAEHYHGAMAGHERHAAQERFLSGETPVICATIAFGMGIDKPDIRLVAHLDMPPSIESYYQEIGRAGRDGQPAECLMFYTKGVWHQRMHFINQLSDESEREQRTNRLRTMMDFCEQSACRWSRMLQYFGERPSAAQCGHCDRCAGEPEEDTSRRIVAPAAPPASPETPASSEPRPLDEREDQLYDALREERHRLAREAGIAAFLVAGNRELAELARQQPGSERELLAIKGFGAKKVAKYGEALLRVIAEFSSDQSDKLSEPVSSPEMPLLDQATEQASAPPPELWQQRFNALSEWRTLTSRNEHCAPSDLLSFAAMRQIAEQTPPSLEALSQVEGVGALAVGRYLDELALILGIQPSDVQQPASPQRIADEAEQVPSWQTSLDLYQAGHTMLAIAERRMLSPGTVASHLVMARKSGVEIDLRPSLPAPEQVQEVQRQLSLSPEASVSELHERLAYRLSRAELQLVIAYLRPSEPAADLC